MAIFTEDQNGKLTKLNSFLAAKEKDVQKLLEKNLLEVLDMHFLASEYVTTFGGRIDTLAVDRNGVPVIIEYKRNKNDTVINQALSYLRWLKQQKVEFFQMLILNRYGEDFLNSMTIDWKNPRVVCVAESYNKFDIDLVEVVPMRIELFRYRYYDSKIFSLEPINISENATVAPGNIQLSEKSAIDPSIDNHIAKSSEIIRKLFAELRSKIFEFDENVIEKATSFYIAYRVANNFAEIHLGKNQIKIHIRPINYIDPDLKVEVIPDSYNWTLSKRIYLKEENDLEYVVNIIEQSYKDVL